MPTVTINQKPITVPDGTTIIQAAEQLSIEIPRYCYHPGLSVAGSCRMCLVEIEKMPKLQPACNTRVTDGMVITTNSPKVKEAVSGVLGVSAHQPSAGLSRLRPGRRMLPARVLHEVRPVRQPHEREQDQAA